jgi:hypothetical protein
MKELISLYKRMSFWWQSLIIVGLEVKYSDPVKKRQIIEALILWKFIREELGQSVSWEERREFLAEHIGSANKYKAIVARLESLPTSIYRRLLWKWNIDFMSLESSLRRLKEEQYQAINDAYEQLLVQRELPRILGWFKCWLHMISVGQLLEEPLDEMRRYERKAAMSYNFCFLDIGFNAYANGVKDDTGCFVKSGQKFISTKNHADDFVVNKEGGRYYWFYRTARSNPAYKPGRKIVMNKWFCPGWWFTIIMHGLFWLVSPAALTIVTFMLARNGFDFAALGWFKGILIGLPAIIMPGWCVLALLRTIITMVIAPLGKNDAFEKYVLMPAGVSILVACAATFCGGAIYLLFAVFLALAVVFTLPGAIMISYVIGRYVVEQVMHANKQARDTEREKLLKNFTDFSIDFQVTVPFFLIIILKPFVEMYGEPIWQWLVALIMSNLVQAFLIGILAVQAVIAVLAVSLPKTLDEEASQKCYLMLEKILLRFTLVFIPCAIAIAIWQTLAHHDLFGLAFVILLASLPVLAVLYGRLEVRIDRQIYKGLYNIRSSDLAALALNQWVRSLSPEARENALEYLSGFVRSNVLYAKEKKTWRLLANNITQDIYLELRALNGIPIDYGFRALCLVIKGAKAQEAWAQAVKEYDQQKEVERKIDLFLEKCSEIFRRRFKLLFDFYQFVKDILGDGCPFILESGSVATSGNQPEKDTGNRVSSWDDDW